ncbi:hypothetical protein [Bacillus fonticola]|nr:hypothetical protein [Bacillus fonticola]
MEIRNYEPKDEQSWLRCRVLSFIQTAITTTSAERKNTTTTPPLNW